MTLGKTLKEEMPIDWVTAQCGVCEMKLFDTRNVEEKSPVIVGDMIELRAMKHRNETSHDDLQVGIEKPQPTKEIDATVTVNG